MYLVRWQDSHSFPYFRSNQFAQIEEVKQRIYFLLSYAYYNQLCPNYVFKIFSKTGCHAAFPCQTMKSYIYESFCFTN